MYISKASNWLYLEYIDLEENNIGTEGEECISGAKWPNLKTIVVDKGSNIELKDERFVCGKCSSFGGIRLHSYIRTEERSS